MATTTAPVDLYLLDIHGRPVPHFPDVPTSPALADLHHYLVDVDAQIAALAAAGMGEEVPLAPRPVPADDTADSAEAAEKAWSCDTFGARGIALHKLRGGRDGWWVTQQECRTSLAATTTGEVDEGLVRFLRRAAEYGGFGVQTAL